MWVDCSHWLLQTCDVFTLNGCSPFLLVVGLPSLANKQKCHVAEPLPPLSEVRRCSWKETSEMMKGCGKKRCPSVCQYCSACSRVWCSSDGALRSLKNTSSGGFSCLPVCSLYLLLTSRVLFSSPVFFPAGSVMRNVCFKYSHRQKQRRMWLSDVRWAVSGFSRKNITAFTSAWSRALHPCCFDRRY